MVVAGAAPPWHMEYAWMDRKLRQSPRVCGCNLQLLGILGVHWVSRVPHWGVRTPHPPSLFKFGCQ